MAMVIGLTLGLLGGGGSILTVPVLVYLFAIEPTIATGYSLFIVGISSLVGAIGYYRNKLIDLKMVAVFGSASLVAVYLARRVIVPSIPDHLFWVGDWAMTRDMGIMVLFAILMVLASYSMIRGGDKQASSDEPVVYDYPVLMLQAALIGTLVGMVGAGGGFLIIPVLVVFSKLPMKMAVGTSLSIIAVNSLMGFVGELQTRTMDWTFLLLFSTLAIIGIFAGMKLSNYIPGLKLKPIFGYFVLIMGIYILGKELLF